MKRKPYTFDGCGINGPDEYRSRLATLTDAGRAAGIGRTLERALNLLTPDVRRALRLVLAAAECEAENRRTLGVDADDAEGIKEANEIDDAVKAVKEALK